MWLRRLQKAGVVAPYNKYYDPRGKFNIYTGTVAMPNCTSYAYLRMEEAMRLELRNACLIRSSGGFGNAKTWYDTTPLPKGHIIKEGAIAVFDGNAGHVCMVEKVISSTRAIISESQYDDDKSRRDYKYWQAREVSLIVGESTIGGVGPLIGYIYPAVADVRVNRDTTKNQIQVNDDYINVRTAPGLSAAKYDGCFCPDGTYNVLDKSDADGYTWYKLDKECWIAGVDEVDYLPKEDVPEYKKLGLDISEWQEGINIAQIKEEGMQFAILRAGFTGWGDGVTKKVDKCFEDFYAQCKASGVPVGAYWYSCATTYDRGRDEAKFMIDNCLKGKYFELPIAIDVEDSHQQQPAGKEAVTAAINGFCDYLKEHNYYPMVYANLNWFKNYIGDIKWDRWVAFWGEGKPDNCNIWQWSSSEHMAGQRVDSNYMYYDYAKYIKDHNMNTGEGIDIYPVDRDDSVNQVYVGVDSLRIRDEASLNGTIMGYCTKNSYYNCLGTSKADNYTWYNLGDNAWIAGVAGVKYLPKDEAHLIPDPVARNTEVSQIYINYPKLNARTEPSLHSKSLGYYSMGYYNVLDTVVKDDYTWYKLGECWAADDVSYYPATKGTGDHDTPQPIDELPDFPEPVIRDTTKDQIHIGDFFLNVRVAPSTSAKKIGMCDKSSWYNVFDVANQNDYTWYQLGNNAWVAGVDGVDYYPAYSVPEPVDEDDTKDQVYIGDVTVRIRSKATTKSDSMGYAQKYSNYNVLEVVKKADYTWYKLGDSAYIAQCDSEITYFPAGTSRKGAKLKEEIPELETALDLALSCVNKNIGTEYYDELYDKVVDLKEFIDTNFDKFDYDYVDEHEYDEIDLLYTTDVHGAWVGYDEDGNYLNPVFSYDDVGNYRDKLAKNNVKALLVDCGDWSRPCRVYDDYINTGEMVSAEKMNNLEYFSSTYGNHEWRWILNDDMSTEDVLNKDNSITACNLFKNGELIYKPYRTAKIGSKRIGVIGIGYPSANGHETYNNGVWTFGEYTFYDGDKLFKEVQKYIDELKDAGFDYIVVITHMCKSTYESDSRYKARTDSLIENTKGLTAVLQGHYNFATNAEMITDAGGNQVLLAHEAGANMNSFGRLQLKGNKVSSYLLDERSDLDVI